MPLCTGRKWGKMKLNEPGKQKLERQKFIAVQDSHKAIFWPASGFKDKTFDFISSLLRIKFDASTVWNRRRWLLLRTLGLQNLTISDFVEVLCYYHYLIEEGHICLFLPLRSIHLHFSKTSRFFPVFAVANTGVCVGQQNKIGHPAGCRFPCWVPAEYK